MKNITLNINITTLLIVGLILFLIIGGGFLLMNNQKDRLKSELELERKLVAALNDSIQITTNKYGEVVVEKLTIQSTINRLEDLNDKLSNEQRALLNRLQSSENKNNIITAALINANIMIDSLLHDGDVLVGDSMITFIEANNPNIQYTIDIFNVTPINNNIIPQMSFRNLNIPNTSYIEFFWADDRREGYPVSFSVTNTNQFLRVHNIESYAIPSMQKENVNPNSWQRFKNWLDNTPGSIGKYVVGGIMGIGIYGILSK